MIRINLAPVETRRRRGAGFTMPSLPIGLGLLFAVLYVVAAGGVAWWWTGLRAEEAQLVADNDRSTKELETLKATLGQGANIKTQLADMKRRVQVIEDLTKGQSRPIRLLDAFADTVPTDLWITSLEDRGAVLRVHGTAFSTKSVSDFMANLRQSGRFKDVEIMISRQDFARSPSPVTFEVTCRFEI